MKCPICGEEMLAGGLISAGISVGWVPKDEFDKKGLRRISYQEWHSIGRRFARALLSLNSSIFFRYWTKTHISEVKNKM